MSALDADLSDWLTENPSWDPRYRFARASDRAGVLRYPRAQAAGTGNQRAPAPTMLPPGPGGPHPCVTLPCPVPHCPPAGVAERISMSPWAIPQRLPSPAIRNLSYLAPSSRRLGGPDTPFRGIFTHD